MEQREVDLAFIDFHRMFTMEELGHREEFHYVSECVTHELDSIVRGLTAAWPHLKTFQREAVRREFCVDDSNPENIRINYFYFRER